MGTSGPARAAGYDALYGVNFDPAPDPTVTDPTVTAEGQ